MTVIYETGSASSPANLVAKLETFAAANGWTVSTVSGGLVFRKATVVVGVFSNATSIFLRGAITYNAAAAWNAQTNPASVSAEINCGAGGFSAYHFYIGDESGFDYLHATIEISSGVFRHIALGEMVKAGSFTGGVYVEGTYWQPGTNYQNFPESSLHTVICDSSGGTVRNNIWVDYDSKSNNWQRIGSASNTSDPNQCTGACRNQGILYAPLTIGAQKFNLITPMYPLTYFASRGSGLRSIIGRIPNMRLLSLRNLNTPGQIVSIGSEDWQVFPMCARSDTWNLNIDVPSSGYYGYAHLR